MPKARRSPVLLAALLLLSLTPAALEAQTQQLLFAAELGDRRIVVETVPDWNGDGVEELLVGATNSASSPDEAWLMAGGSGQLLLSLVPVTDGHTFGWSVAAAGDVDGDGTEDWVVGSPRAENPTGQETGAASVYSGVDGSLLWSVFGSTGDRLGQAVAGVGDLTGDGLAEIAVGVPNSDATGTNAGLARVYSGSDGSTLHELEGSGTSSEQFGFTLASLADVDVDGTPDMIVGTPPNGTTGPDRGLARVYSGATGAPLFSFGGANNDRLGAGVGPAGDRDGDGRPDFFTIAQEDQPDGTLRIHSGVDGSVIATWAGLTGSGSLGPAAVLLPDVSGDGEKDWLVGSTSVSPNGFLSGSAALVSGVDFAILSRVDGQESGERLGTDVARAPDWNGDGAPDWVVTSSKGALRVYTAQQGFSPSLAAVKDVVVGENDNEGLGWALARVGDRDGDGVEDWAVGIPGGETPGPGFGRVEIRSGATTEPFEEVFAPDHLIEGYSFGVALAVAPSSGPGQPFLAVGQTAAVVEGLVHLFDSSLRHTLTVDSGIGLSQFGTSLAWVPDTNGDGSDELLIGAPFALEASFVRLIETVDGSVRWTEHAAELADFFGLEVGQVGDVDGDGFADVAASAIRFDGPGESRGRLVVYSAVTGSVIHEWIGQEDEERLGSGFAGAGDVDGDGFDDVWVGSSGLGEIHLYSGATGERLPGVSIQPEPFLGASLVRVGDVDGDGVGDLVSLRASQAAFSAGGVSVLSGRTGEMLFSAEGSRAQEGFGAALADGGDQDGDGLSEVLVGANRNDLGGFNAGAVFILQRPDFLNFCPAEANSSGQAAFLSAEGSSQVLRNELDLRVQGAPSETFGVFFFGPGSQHAPFGEGSLCLAGGLQRLGGPRTTDLGGSLLQAVDLQAPPADGVLIAGMRFGFQFWFRDPLAGPSGFHLSSAVSIALR